MMAKNISILLGEHFEHFIDVQVKSGKYSSPSEVIRTALRLFEQQETLTKILVNELEAGEESNIISNFDRKTGLAQLHSKHLINDL